MHLRSKHWYMIDFIIVRQRDIRDVRVTHAMRGAKGWTDHRLVKSVLKLQIVPLDGNRPKTFRTTNNVVRLKDPILPCRISGSARRESPRSCDHRRQQWEIDIFQRTSLTKSGWINRPPSRSARSLRPSRSKSRLIFEQCRTSGSGIKQVKSNTTLTLTTLRKPFLVPLPPATPHYCRQMGRRWSKTRRVYKAVGPDAIGGLPRCPAHCLGGGDDARRLPRRPDHLPL